VGGALSGAASASSAANTGMSATPARNAGEGAHTRNPGKPAASGDTDSRHREGAAAGGDISASASADASMNASTSH
jgi:hypothetical protein